MWHPLGASPSTTVEDVIFLRSIVLLLFKSARGIGGTEGWNEISASNATMALAIADWTIMSTFNQTLAPLFFFLLFTHGYERECRLLSTTSVSTRLSKMLPSNPECRAASHSSLSNAVGAEQRTCVPEFARIKKSTHLEDAKVEVGDASDARLAFVVHDDGGGGDTSLWQAGFLLTEGGFHADAPTIQISDVGGSPFV